ncbi:MAG TPA: DUF4410 domain-containing protein [Candidatus Binataceae bacterium]|nr:DUF4410 domain-containing protein [Candidatus Binataceae bacterium]
MKFLSSTAPILFVFLIVGCASTSVTQQTPMVAQGLPRPNQIWVYNFVANPADMPANSSIAASMSAPSTPPTPDEVEQGRQLGALIASELVNDINAMGMNAVQAGPGASPQVGDAVIRGYIVSATGGGAGSAVQRFVVGFGAGTTEMDTVVEGYAVTQQGWIKLGSGTLTSSGNKAPGMVVPAAVAIATANPVGLIVVGGAKIYSEASGRSGLQGRAKATADQIAEQLRLRFQDRGWIS